MEISHAQFTVGQLINHKLFDYRGVIIDVDPIFQGADEWYEQVAGTRPPKDQPWYHVLVHDATHSTYVAERNLEADDSKAPIRHPLLETYFSNLENGRYVFHRRQN